MNIKLGNFQRDIELNIELATCLEFTLTWSDSVDDPSSLVRINAAALGVVLDEFALLPSYKPERDKILIYGFKVLQRLLEKNVPLADIYSSGTKALSAMAERMPKQESIDDKKDFFHSPEQGK